MLQPHPSIEGRLLLPYAARPELQARTKKGPSARLVTDLEATLLHIDLSGIGKPLRPVVDFRQVRNP